MTLEPWLPPPMPQIIDISPDPDRLTRIEAKVDQMLAIISTGGIVMEETHTITVHKKKRKMMLMRPQQQQTVQLIKKTKGEFAQELNAMLTQKRKE